MARAIAPPIMPPITPYAAIFILLLLVHRGNEVVCRYKHPLLLLFGQAIRKRSYGFATDDEILFDTGRLVVRRARIVSADKNTVYLTSLV